MLELLDLQMGFFIASLSFFFCCCVYLSDPAEVWHFQYSTYKEQKLHTNET